MSWSRISPARDRLGHIRNGTLACDGFCPVYHSTVRQTALWRTLKGLNVKDAIGHNRRAYVLVNNRLEGNAPLTVQAFTDLLS